MNRMGVPDKFLQLITGQIYVWGKFVEYSGPIIAPEDLKLTDDVGIEPWKPLPTMALLTIQGVTVAGPARLELLRSYIHELCNDASIERELAAIRREVDTPISSKSDKVINAH